MKTSTVMATGMSGLLLAGLAGTAAPAMAAESAPAGEVSTAVAGSYHSKAQVVLHAPSAATKGDSITLQGKVKKNHHHKTRVVIQKKHGKKWQKVDATKTNKKGKFHTADAFDKKRKVTLRAKATGHGLSNTQTVTFTKASNGGGTNNGGGITPPPDNGGGTLPPNHGGGTGDSGDVTPPDDPMQVFVPEGDTQALLNDIDQAPNGATLHLSGEYNVSNTGQEKIGLDIWYSGIVVNKALTLDGGWLHSNGKANVIDVGPQGNLKLEGGIVVSGGHTEKHGGGIYNAGIVVADNAYIWANTAEELGGGVYNNADATFTLNGGQVGGDTEGHGNKAWISGGGITNDGGTVNLNGGSITNNTADSAGGGIENIDNGTVNLNGGSITNNSTKVGGGIDNDYGTVNLVSGSITNNTADSAGGGIFNTNNEGRVFNGTGERLTSSALVAENHLKDGSKSDEWNYGPTK